MEFCLDPTRDAIIVPDDVLSIIVSFGLAMKTLMAVRATCKKWKKIVDLVALNIFMPPLRQKLLWMEIASDNEDGERIIRSYSTKKGVSIVCEKKFKVGKTVKKVTFSDRTTHLHPSTPKLVKSIFPACSDAYFRINPCVRWRGESSGGLMIGRGITEVVINFNERTKTVTNLMGSLHGSVMWLNGAATIPSFQIRLSAKAFVEYDWTDPKWDPGLTRPGVYSMDIMQHILSDASACVYFRILKISIVSVTDEIDAGFLSYTSQLEGWSKSNTHTWTIRSPSDESASLSRLVTGDRYCCILSTPLMSVNLGKPMLSLSRLKISHL